MPENRHRVALLAFPDMPVFEFAVPCEVFGVPRPDLVDPWYDFRVVGTAGAPVPTKTGFSVDTPYDLAALPWADTVVVPAWPHIGRRPPEPLLRALRNARRRGARVVSICTGAFVLAEAGILDGLRATTHWMYADTFARRFPRVELAPDVLYVDEGHVLTSAGTAAGIDLCLHVVRRDFGVAVANGVARRMLVAPQRPGDQAQRVVRPVPEDDRHDPIADVCSWMRDHLDEQVTLDAIAQRAAMTTRTLVRRFKSATGTTPHRWLVRERVRAAQELLETTDLPIEHVARACGMGSAVTLRSHFQQQLSIAPTAYRRKYRAAAAAGSTRVRAAPARVVTARVIGAGPRAVSGNGGAGV